MNLLDQAGYLPLYDSGELNRRVLTAFQHLTSCDVCPLHCGVDRTAGELGVCQTGLKAQVSSYGPHPGEEHPISGSRGSGTIFFSRCNLHCIYCQNADISQLSFGREYDAVGLAEIMLRLQDMGCQNINLVSPSHVVPQVLAAVKEAASQGLWLPLVYNSGGYDSMEMLALLEGVVDIYMPDMKYGDAQIALRYSRVPNYPEINKQAVLEMFRQVGDLQVDANGIARSGLLVRHLVLPNNKANSEIILRFLAEKISKRVYLNLMAQYHPAYLAGTEPGLARRITRQEYQQVISLAIAAGLTNIDSQFV